MLFTTINFNSLKRVSFFMLFLGVCSFQTQAQNYVHSMGMGGIFNDEATSILMDDDKNVYLAGNYVDSVDFDPSIDTAIHRTEFAPNAFIAKYDETGKYEWSVAINGYQIVNIKEIALGNYGHVYAVGDFIDSVYFNSTDSQDIRLGSNGVFDVFIAKYDTTGKLIWAKTFGGPAPDWGYGLAVDKDDNVITTGSFLAFADFDASANSHILNAFAGSPDIFLTKYDSAGNFVWAKQAGSNSFDEGRAVEVDTMGNIYLTGSFTGTPADFGTISLNSNGADDAFLAKYNGNGNTIWAKALGGVAPDAGSSIKLNGNDIYVTGRFQATADIDPTATAPSLISHGDDDVFLAKFDTVGNYVWSRGMGGTMEDNSHSLGIDSLFNVYITGFYNDAIQFDQGINAFGLIAEGDKDIFLAKYDDNGDAIWAKGFGSATDDEGKSLVLDNDYFYLSGYYGDSVDFNPSSTNNFMTSTPYGSIFMAKYAICNDNYFVLSDTICGGQTYTINATYTYTDAGSYRVELMNGLACDTVIRLNLEVDTVDVNVSQIGPSLSASASMATYQWMDCTNDTLITGADSSNYTATSNGSYAVIITQNNCSDTSSCFVVNTVGIPEMKSSKLFKVYPNPSNGNFVLNFLENTNISIFNTLGEIVYTGSVNKGKNNLELNHLKKGIYYLEVTGSGESMKLLIMD